MKIKLTRKQRLTPIRRSNDIAPILTEYYKRLDKYEKYKEHFLVVSLKIDLTINWIDIVSIGSLIGTVVGVQETFRRAIIEGGTAKLILAHNHPSKNIKPSETDIKLTHKLVKAGKLLDIPIIDHLIVTTNKSYCSMADDGLIKF